MTQELAARASHRLQLARLFAGPLADRARAAAAYVATLASDPSCQEAITALRARLGGDERGIDISETAARQTGAFQALLESVASLADEGERHAQLVARLNALLPDLEAVAVPRADQGSNGAAASAVAWARAACSGHLREQAHALERMADEAPAPVKTVFPKAAAADRCRAGGDLRRGKAIGPSFATQSEPTDPRTVATLADVVALQGGDRPAAFALERAIGLVGPRIEWCASLADALEGARRGGPRRVGRSAARLCGPVTARSSSACFRRVLGTPGAGRLSDALAWLMSQAQPVSWQGEHFAHALGELARIDVDRAVVVARRALDVFGPRINSLRQAMLDVEPLGRASDDGFIVSTFERWLSSGAEAGERRELFIRLAARCGNAWATRRAAHASWLAPSTKDCRVQNVDDQLSRMPAPTSPDAQLWRLENGCGAAPRREQTEGCRRGVARALSSERGTVGILADDRVGAIAAWQRAARVAPTHGYATLARDLVGFRRERRSPSNTWRSLSKPEPGSRRRRRHRHRNGWPCGALDGTTTLRPRPGCSWAGASSVDQLP